MLGGRRRGAVEQRSHAGRDAEVEVPQGRAILILHLESSLDLEPFPARGVPEDDSLIVEIRLLNVTDLHACHLSTPLSQLTWRR